MKPDKMDILIGNALFVLANLVPLNIHEITWVWGMYSEKFKSAVQICHPNIRYAGFYGPYLEFPAEEEESLKKALLEEGLVDEIIEIVRGKNVKSLKINKKGLDYLEFLAGNGMKFNARKELEKLKPVTARYRAGK